MTYIFIFLKTGARSIDACELADAYDRLYCHPSKCWKSRMWHTTEWYMLKIWRWWCAPTLKIDRAPYSHKSSISYLTLPVLTARLVFCWARGCSTCDLFVSFIGIPSLSNVLHLSAGNCHSRPTCLCHDSEPLITIPDKSQLSQSWKACCVIWCDCDA